MQRVLLVLAAAVVGQASAAQRGPGYYVAGNASIAVGTRCAPPAVERCLGFDPSLDATRCGEGFEQATFGCASCGKGFYRGIGGACPKCPSVDFSGAFVIPILVNLGGALLVFALLASAKFAVLLLSELCEHGVGVTPVVLKAAALQAAKEARLATSSFALAVIGAAQLLASINVAAQGAVPLVFTHVSNSLRTFLLIPPFFHSECIRDFGRSWDNAILIGGIALVLLDSAGHVRALRLEQLICGWRCCHNKRGTARVCALVCRDRVTPLARYTISVLITVSYVAVTDTALSTFACAPSSALRNEELGLVRDPTTSSCFNAAHGFSFAMGVIAFALVSVLWPITTCLALVRRFASRSNSCSDAMGGSVAALRTSKVCLHCCDVVAGDDASAADSASSAEAELVEVEGVGIVAFNLALKDLPSPTGLPPMKEQQTKHHFTQPVALSTDPEAARFAAQKLGSSQTMPTVEGGETRKEVEIERERSCSAAFTVSFSTFEQDLGLDVELDLAPPAERRFSGDRPLSLSAKFIALNAVLKDAEEGGEVENPEWRDTAAKQDDSRLSSLSFIDDSGLVDERIVSVTKNPSFRTISDDESFRGTTWMNPDGAVEVEDNWEDLDDDVWVGRDGDQAEAQRLREEFGRMRGRRCMCPAFALELGCDCRRARSGVHERPTLVNRRLAAMKGRAHAYFAFVDTPLEAQYFWVVALRHYTMLALSVLRIVFANASRPSSEGSATVLFTLTVLAMLVFTVATVGWCPFHRADRWHAPAAIVVLLLAVLGASTNMCISYAELQVSGAAAAVRVLSLISAVVLPICLALALVAFLSARACGRCRRRRLGCRWLRFIDSTPRGSARKRFAGHIDDDAYFVIPKKRPNRIASMQRIEASVRAGARPSFYGDDDAAMSGPHANAFARNREKSQRMQEAALAGLHVALKDVEKRVGSDSGGDDALQGGEETRKRSVEDVAPLFLFNSLKVPGKSGDEAGAGEEDVTNRKTLMRTGKNQHDAHKLRTTIAWTNVKKLVKEKAFEHVARKNPRWEPRSGLQRSQKGGEIAAKPRPKHRNPDWARSTERSKKKGSDVASAAERGGPVLCSQDQDRPKTSPLRLQREAPIWLPDFAAQSRASAPRPNANGHLAGAAPGRWSLAVKARPGEQRTERPVSGDPDSEMGPTSVHRFIARSSIQRKSAENARESGTMPRSSVFPPEQVNAMRLAAGFDDDDDSGDAVRLPFAEEPTALEHAAVSAPPAAALAAVELPAGSEAEMSAADDAEVGWDFIGEDGAVHGPHSVAEMVEWRNGWFSADTLVAPTGSHSGVLHDGAFVPFDTSALGAALPSPAAHEDFGASMAVDGEGPK